MPFSIGETVGPYQILEQLGQGGMATVYKAYHPALDRYVAIKALHPAFMEDPNFIARFQREARVVAKLEHPNIVPIYDFSEHEGRPYLVMKFIEGETLKAILKRQAIDKTFLVKIIQAVGSALSYAHKQGILHRDVKPSNILISDNGEIYLADFGLARIAQAGESTISSDVMLGTPQYISPEQAMGKSDLDEGTDIYSFGVVLYELLVGRVPYSADTPFSIIHDHIYKPLPLPSSINPEINKELEKALLKALAKNRDDRYATIDEMTKRFVDALNTTSETPQLEETLPAETMPLAETTPPSDAGKDQIGKHKEKKSKKRFLVPLLVGLPMLAILCLFSLMALRERRQNNASQLTPPPSQVVIKDRRTQLEEEIQKDPNNPYLHFELAQVYRQQNNLNKAEEELQRAVNLGQGDNDFLLTAAERMFKGGLWIPAANMYLRAFQNDAELYNDKTLQNNFHQAAYLAAELPRSVEGIPIDQIKRIDPLYESITRARYLLYHQAPEDALATLGPYLDQPEFTTLPEAYVLLTEIYISQNDLMAAYKNFELLKEFPDKPDWIADFEKEIANTFTGDFIGAYNNLLRNPEDPYAYLRMFDVALGLNAEKNANDMLDQAANLAGQDPYFYFDLAEILEKYNVWTFAAQMYLISEAYGGIDNPPLLKDRIDHALYNAASEDDALIVLDKSKETIDPLMWEIIETRHILIAKQDYKLAGENIDSLLEKDGSQPIVKLLAGEYYLITEEFDKGKSYLEELQQVDDVPPWIKDQANVLMERFIK